MEVAIEEELVDWVRSHYFGKYRGTVTDNADPTSRGRIKVKVPAVLGDVDIWAMPCVPYAGAGVGFYALPDKESGVWVEFEGGDPSYPIWAGCFWADGEIPDKKDAAIKVWRTGKITLRMDDTAQEFMAKSDKGSTIKLSRDAVTESGGSKHTVGSAGVSSAKGRGKAEVTATSVRLNSGSFEVM